MMTLDGRATYGAAGSAIGARVIADVRKARELDAARDRDAARERAADRIAEENRDGREWLASWRARGARTEYSSEPPRRNA